MTLFPVYAQLPLSFTKGEGIWLYDQSNTPYLDFASGIATTLLGHAHPHLTKTLTEAASRPWHTSNLFHIPEQEKLASRLTENSFADKAFFCNSGTEAVETAIKTCRIFHYAAGNPERTTILTAKGAFHGRSLATIAAGGQPKHMEGFNPTSPGFTQVDFNDLNAITNAITPETAGILVEPIQGEGGIRALPPKTLSHLRTLCDTHAILLIFDEVQCGMGRTGRLFAHQWSNIFPDILASAKGLGGGFPIGACLATDHAASGMVVGRHGSTFGGNPLACSIANAVLDIVLEDGFLPKVETIADTLYQSLTMLANEHPKTIASVRGKGLMLGLELHQDPRTFADTCRQHKLLAVPAGENILRLLPPLILTHQHVEEAIKRLHAACS